MEEQYSVTLEGRTLPFRGLFGVCDKDKDSILGVVLLDDDMVCTTFTTEGCLVTSIPSIVERWAKRGQFVLGHNGRGKVVELLVLDENYEQVDFYLVPLLKREGQNTIILSQYERYREHVKDIVPEAWNKQALEAVKPQRGTKGPRL